MAGNLTAMIASIFSGSAVSTDPYFEYTTLLLPGNGTNGANNNTFLDGSTNNFTITRNGNTTQGTFSPFSQTGWGNFATATSGSVGFSCTTASLVGQTASTFTAECWIYMTEAPVSGDGVPSLIGMDAAYNSSVYLGFGPNASRVLVLRWFDGASKTVTGSTTLALNTWYHVAVVANSNALAMYVNGNLETLSGTTTLTNRNGTTTDFSLLLNSSVSNYQFRGYVSNIRVCTSAVYTTPFTPSTLPLTTTSQGATNCQLLTAQDNRFIDKSSNGYLLVAQGSPTVVAFSPFNPTASWSAATNGGSGYFDGNGDYLSVANDVPLQLGTDNFTIEFWWNGSPTGTFLQNIGTLISGTESGTYRVGTRVNSVNAVYFARGNGTGFDEVSFNVNVNDGAWHHIAIVRSSGVIACYTDGISRTVLSGSANISGTCTSSNALRLGYNQRDNVYITGYMSNARIVKGVAVYTGAFTPPTAPITNAGSTSAASYPSTTNVNTSFASSATSLLLNFTNAGIYDATSKNDLETVGNAQISTAISAKWGSGSMYFDGAGDYLRAPDNVLFTMGSGNFTIECWVFRATSGSRTFIFGQSNGASDAATSVVAEVTSANKLRSQVSIGNTPYEALSTNNFPQNEWVHVAVVREGGSLKQYINGSLDGQNTSLSTSSINDSSEIFGVGSLGSYPGLWWNGYMNDFRITRGYARYTANFTPPTAAFPTL